MANPDDVAKAFTTHYYQTFDTNRAGLVSLFQPMSMMTFEGEQFQGPEAIVQKLSNLPFQKCLHSANTIDAQPTNGGILVFVSGNIQVEGEERPLKFSEVFHLCPTPEGSYFVFNDMFRLNYG
mmetsp:Transcript_11909/g.16143  ORF Transcript_11909/g.16143 Transcript_11909/m.16143 type:complete len:123 (+) Transcript_11909:40-408(+)|eukprot:CAMPEP_0196579100 /NCGR_PEP_ID=MMETSP1081-20130531/17648_1 /TAXON_ID=36882 /ORGANISM="Pyramimonas amylifera, Strain CCMP720" /LENGTH=122 /DNA_ID=CAMNT_0041898563 /DNA_START=40 /DNA_END=408 /DNA_ORIENTATION=-